MGRRASQTSASPISARGSRCICSDRCRLSPTTRPVLMFRVCWGPHCQTSRFSFFLGGHLKRGLQIRVDSIWHWVYLDRKYHQSEFPPGCEELVWGEGEENKAYTGNTPSAPQVPEHRLQKPPGSPAKVGEKRSCRRRLRSLA